MKSAPLFTLAVLTALSGSANADFAHYPGDPPTVKVDRSKVIADLQAARAAGQLWTRDKYPLDVQPDPALAKSRAQVVAETNEARRLGLLEPRGDGNFPVATPENERLIAEAGLRASRMMASTTR